MSVEKLILPIFSLFILSLILPVSTTYADTVLLACPQIMRSNTTELVYDAPLTASRLPEMRDWDRESTSLEILYCESPNWVPYTDLMSIGYTLGINRLGVNEETDYADYSEESVLKPFGNGRAYFRGTPYGGSSNPAMTLIDKAGSCEIVFGAGVGPTEAGMDLYVRSKATAPMLAEHQRNAERMTKEMTEAINKLKADIAANRELAEFCAVDGIPIPTKKDEKPSLPSSRGGPRLIEFFGINPYQTWLRLKETMEVTEFITSGELEEFTESFFVRMVGGRTSAEKEAEREKVSWLAAIQREANISPKVEQEAWKVKALTEESVTDVAGASNTKRYSWDTDSGVVINSSLWENVEFKEPVVDEQEITRTVKFRGEGEVEVKVKNANPNQNKVKVETDFFDLFVIQTHFWVSQSTDKKLAVVGVYEGEVEVKTKDGKTTRVKPEGDKPGILVVSKKLSIAKLAVVGVVLAAIAGGIVWLVRKKRLRRR